MKQLEATPIWWPEMPRQESLREEISMWRDVKAGDTSSRESWQVWPHLDAEERKKVVGPQAQEALLNRLRQRSIMLINMLT